MSNVEDGKKRTGIAKLGEIIIEDSDGSGT